MTGPTHRLALVLSLALVASPATVTAQSATDSPPATITLSGPFGTVVGSVQGEPATAAPDGRPLDTWMREATLELAVEPALDPATSIVVDSVSRSDGSTRRLPLVSGRWVTAPDTAGEHVITVTLEYDDADQSRHAWLLEVPDRPGDYETLLEMPAIDASVVASSGAVMGVRGHGCHVGMCQEAGFRPPAASLEPLTVAVGQPLTLELDDGSAIVHWEGRLEPQPGTAAETRFASATFEEPVAGPALTGLEPDRPGEWLLELRADYDRERGWQWYLFRLVAE